MYFGMLPPQQQLKMKVRKRFPSKNVLILVVPQLLLGRRESQHLQSTYYAFFFSSICWSLHWPRPWAHSVAPIQLPFQTKMKEEMRMCQNERAPTIKIRYPTNHVPLDFRGVPKCQNTVSSRRERSKTVGGFTRSFFQKSLHDMVPTQYELPFEGPRCIFEFSSNPRNRRNLPKIE